MKSFLTLLLTLMAGYCPDLRERVVPSVVMITNSAETSGGTGFYIKAPSGRTYIATNRHICALAENGIVYVREEKSDRAIPRRVLEVSKITDACLVEGLANREGLVMGEEPKAGQHVFAFGHPFLQPITESSGTIIGEHEIALLNFEITSPEDVAKCKLAGGREQEIPSLFGSRRGCMSTLNSEGTTVIIYPGNSGSPLVDGQGKIVGILFAASSYTNWGEAVTYQDLCDFLQPW